jgi:pseudouridine synthase
MAKERVQKILARAGIASRRKAEELIVLGLVTINGKTAKLGDQAEYGKDSVKVEGKLIHSTEAKAYLLFNKPKGVISMMGDPQGRPSLEDFLGQVKYRLFPVGRLDYNSEGLILLTNDGDFSEKIQRRDDIVRVYHVKIGKHPSPEEISRLEKGGRVGNRNFKPHSVRLAQEFTRKSMIEITVVGSGAIDLKTYFEAKGIQTERIIRVGFGHLKLGNLEPGKFRYLKGTQAMSVLEQPELGMKRLEFDQEVAEKKRERFVQSKELARKREEFREKRRPRRSREDAPRIIIKKRER